MIRLSLILALLLNLHIDSILLFLILGPRMRVYFMTMMICRFFEALEDLAFHLPVKAECIFLDLHESMIPFGWSVRRSSRFSAFFEPFFWRAKTVLLRIQHLGAAWQLDIDRISNLPCLQVQADMSEGR